MAIDLPLGLMTRLPSLMGDRLLITRHMAACVRFWTLSFCKSLFMRTFTAASEIFSWLAISLFKSPFTRHSRICASGSDSPTSSTVAGSWAAGITPAFGKTAQITGCAIRLSALGGNNFCPSKTSRSDRCRTSPDTSVGNTASTPAATA